jgi:hypothetical protein
MKKHVWLIFSLAFMILLAGCEVQGVVTERPADVVYDQPVAPGPDYIWIGGDWIWSGGRYGWRAGHWERRREGREWHEGHWNQHSRGWRWERGHW